MMLTNLDWNDLLILAGFLFIQKSPTQFSMRQEQFRNKNHLSHLLNYGGFEYIWQNDGVIEITSPPPPFDEWIQILTINGEKGMEDGLYKDIGLENLDVPMLAIIRHLNRLGITTNGCCSGHPDRSRSHTTPYINVENPTFAQVLVEFIKDLGFNARLQSARSVSILENHEKLFELGFAFSKIKDIGIFFKKVKGKREQVLESLLSIPGESSHEDPIRNYLMDILPNLLDKVWVDNYGNILGQKQFLRNGPIIMLSAHMDIKSSFSPHSYLDRTENVIRRSQDILGADDRAGIAMIINLLTNLQSCTYRGSIKIIFTVEEEIGQIGAENIDPNFYKDVNYAISLDRRNGCDIITHSNRYTYGSEEYGKIFENASRILWDQQPHYKIECGGISDLRVWSQRGIPSVNLSIGFYHEHCPDEYLNLDEWHRTHDLVFFALDSLSWKYREEKRKSRFNKGGTRIEN